MKNYTRILSILALALLTIVMPATAQTGDNKNKAIVETADGTQQLNTDEISIIRFDGDKVIFVQPWGESVFDRTLRSLTFLRPLPGTLRLTVNAGINEHQTNRAQAIDGGNLKTTWESGDVVYVYADESSTTSIGTLTPTTYGSNSATLTGDIDATGLVDAQPLYFSTKPRPFNFASQDGTVESLFYFTSSAEVAVDGGNASLSGNLNFTRPVAIVKFSLKDGVGSAINVNSLTISAASNKLVKGYSNSISRYAYSSYNYDAGSASMFGDYGAYKILDGNNVNDGWTYTKWCSSVDDKTDGIWYCQFHTNAAVRVDGYTFITGNDNADCNGRNPYSWVLKAKANEGDAWTTIATVTNDATMKDLNCEPYDFNVDAPGTYQYFRLEISANHGDNCMQLTAMQLWCNGDIAPAYGDITVTPAAATNELFVALLNENASADTYTLMANGGGTSYVYNKSDITFTSNKYYAIGVNMSSPLAASNITVIAGNQGTSFPLGDGYGYDKLLDGNKFTKWCSLTEYAGTYDQRVASTGKDMVMWKTASSVVMTGYVLTTASDTQGYADRNWKSWTVYGGNFADEAAAQAAADGAWTQIHQVENDDVLEGINTKDYYYFINNTTAYQYYKVVIDAIQSVSDNIQQMGEFTMLTKNAAPDPSLARPLTFEAKADNFTVTLTSNMNPLPSLEYSIDGGAWNTYTCNAATPAVNTGQTISFRGNNSNFFYYDWEPHTSNFTCSADCYLYGNIMSLLSTDNYATATSVGEAAFLALFEGNTNIYSHNTKELLLPATTLARSCYEGMFRSCTHLTTAPNLPAETLAEYCYSSMFNGCTELVTAPQISATTLADNCCESMFAYCTNLTTGPTLYATTLTKYCYVSMFQSCSSLNSVTCLATDISADNCLNGWLQGVADTGTFTAANNNVGWSTGEDGIPSGWNRVNKNNIVDLSKLTADYEAKDGDILINTLAGNYKITIANGATVTLRDATINGVHDWDYEWAGITCLGNATIILEGTNTVKGFCREYPGIQAAHNGTGSGDEYTLTIQGTGSLTASSNGKATGIGAGKSYECGNITISGGTINATGGEQAAGIGGCSFGDCGNITISGGTVTASGGDDAAGIGSGADRTCGSITISGGTITATGRSGGAGIGSGADMASCGNISISGGTVTATGGNKGAGIGGGKGASCGSITITDGVTSVTATMGEKATYSIGAGPGGSCGTVTIGGVEGAITESPYTYPAPATGHALALAVVGEIVGTDGLAYDVADKDNLPIGVTAVAMVAYKDGSNGLAIQLNASPSLMDWESANSYTGYPAVSGGVATWRLPSMDDWQNMFVGCAKSGDAEKSNYMDPIAGFKEKIAATGIAFDSNGYWSPSGTYSWAVDVNLYDTYATASFSSTPGYYNKYVLGCLAF